MTTSLSDEPPLPEATRTCPGCGEPRRLGEYYGHKTGRPATKCKVCWRAINKRARDRHKADPVQHARNLASRRKYEATRRKSRTKQQCACRERTRAAIRRGEVRARPPHCERCGCECTPSMHHTDPTYRDHLSIRWLCRRCHEEEENRLADGGVRPYIKAPRPAVRRPRPGGASGPPRIRSPDPHLQPNPPP